LEVKHLHLFTRWFSSGLLRRVVWKKSTDVSEVLATVTIALIIEAANTYETSADFYRTARRSKPEDSHLHSRRREDLKSQSFTSFLSTSSTLLSFRNNCQSLLW
jgi:hypothetical protein